MSSLFTVIDNFMFVYSDLEFITIGGLILNSLR